jgi:hypothetical protein
MTDRKCVCGVWDGKILAASVLMGGKEDRDFIMDIINDGGDVRHISVDEARSFLGKTWDELIAARKS